jgi:exodeoxyribonuclease V beta subunit
MRDYKPLDPVTVSLDGTSLIEASAGTGKTFTIAHLYLRLLLERGLAPGNILVVTFTEAATKELRDRIRKNLSAALAAVQDHGADADPTIRAVLQKFCATGSRDQAAFLLKKALINFDEAAIFTIHGFCRRMLGDNSFESSLLFDTELVPDQQEIVQEVVDDFWRMTFSDSDVLLAAVAEHRGLTIPVLVELAAETVRKPLLQLVPEAGPASPDSLIRLFGELRAEWKKSAGDIQQLLSTDRGLSRAADKYQHEHLDRLIENLEAALFRAPAAAYLKSIDLFTTSAIAANTKKKFEPPCHRFFDLCEEFVRQAHSAVMSIKQRFFAYFKQELYQRKRRRNIQCFDDLLLDLRACLQAPAGSALAAAVRKNFTAVLIDEFQDTDPVQYEIFDMLFNTGSGHSLFLIGDPKQSIYGFRGADIFAYIAAATAAAPGKKYTLTANWRSETGFVEAVNRFFSGARNPFVLGDAVGYYTVAAAPGSKGNKAPLVIRDDGPESLRLWFLKQDAAAAGGSRPANKDDAVDLAVAAVVREIARILELATRGSATIGGRPVQPSDFAILVLRNEDALRFVEPLRALHIPAVLAKTGSIFQAPEAQDIERVLRAVAAPRQSSTLNAALATDLIGCDAEQLRGFIEDEEKLGEYEAHVQNFTGFNELWTDRGFSRMFRALLAQYRVRERLLGLPGGERRLTNVLHIAELLHETAREQQLGPAGLLARLARLRENDSANEEHELRLERDDEAVQILTVFRSKGLQYPIVFCPFMWQRGAERKQADVIFHKDARVYLDIGSSEQQAARLHADREVLSELVRLLYVGITRAQNRCYLTCGKIGRFAASALDYLFSGGTACDADVRSAVRKEIAGLPEEDLYDVVATFAKNAAGLMRVETPRLFEPPARPGPQDDSFRAAACRPFPEDIISRDWGIASYSRLTAREHRAPAGPEEKIIKHDEPAGAAQGQDEKKTGGFFDFPRGTVAGSCIHSIFESLDFTGSDLTATTALITRCMKRYGLYGSAGRDTAVAAVHDMLEKVLRAPLLPDRPGFTLGSITRQQRLPELGFFYPLKKITPEKLSAVFEKHSAGVFSRAAPEQPGSLDFRPVEGFMQGFIDLVFLHDGKYYLLDWKTNHLGATYQDYAPERLRAAMREFGYTLQYGLYTVALHKYLQARIAGYRYRTFFGGVLYIFVRGVNPDIPGSGIFYDLPAEELVQELCALTG